MKFSLYSNFTVQTNLQRKVPENVFLAAEFFSRTLRSEWTFEKMYLFVKPGEIGNVGRGLVEVGVCCAQMVDQHAEL